MGCSELILIERRRVIYFDRFRGVTDTPFASLVVRLNGGWSGSLTISILECIDAVCVLFVSLVNRLLKL